MLGRVAGSLKNRIAVVAAILLMVAMTLVTLLVTHILHGEMESMLSKQQFTTATYIARDIDAKVRLRMDGLVRVANNVPSALIADPKLLQTWLEDRRAIHTLFPTGLMVIPPDGGPTLAETPRLATRPKSFTDRDWFRGVLATKKPFISKPLIARATGEPALVIAVPLLGKDNELLGVLAGVTPLAAPGFLALIIGAKPGNEGSYHLISPEHRLNVLGTDVSTAVTPLPEIGTDPLFDLAVAGKEGVRVTKNQAGLDELISIVPVSQTGWSLLAREPAASAFEPVTNAVRNSLLLALLLAVPLIALLLAAVTKLLTPVTVLSDQLQAMAEGSREMLPLDTHVPNEVSEVASNFNRLQQRFLDQEHRLAELAHADALTGLPNRITINDRLETELLRIRRSGLGMALLFLDLDGFKPVNDQYGHQVGDQVLVQVAERLQTCVRNIDTVARIGGDEFLILLGESEDPLDGAKRVAQHCIDVLRMPFRIGEVRVGLGVSLGIAVTHGPEVVNLTPAQLIGFADMAMYQAKADGRGRYVVYSPEQEA